MNTFLHIVVSHYQALHTVISSEDHQSSSRDRESFVVGCVCAPEVDSYNDAESTLAVHPAVLMVTHHDHQNVFRFYCRAHRWWRLTMHLEKRSDGASQCRQSFLRVYKAMFTRAWHCFTTIGSGGLKGSTSVSSHTRQFAFPAALVSLVSDFSRGPMCVLAFVNVTKRDREKKKISVEFQLAFQYMYIKFLPYWSKLVRVLWVYTLPEPVSQVASHCIMKSQFTAQSLHTVSLRTNVAWFP